MVSRKSTPFSATKVATTASALASAMERVFELEREVKRLWHHVSVLSNRNHVLSREKEKVVVGEAGKEEVAVEVAIGVASVPVAEHPAEMVAQVARVVDDGIRVVGGPLIGDVPVEVQVKESAGGKVVASKEHKKRKVEEDKVVVPPVGPSGGGLLGEAGGGTWYQVQGGELGFVPAEPRNSGPVFAAALGLGGCAAGHPVIRPNASLIPRGRPA